MIFKVFYQETLTETPVREKTQSLYIEAKDEVEVRQLLKEEAFHIEYVELLSDKHLEYEKAQPDFSLWEK
ncbi:DNA-dependent RNA polymerase subunit epsilon [Listeria costaricensis]|uniref:DNA-dependent RNA polymerase subunit epsilon n=1 Tax=Listeria costaricensis TaxID=2026604 RepID=UPI000C06B91D|nr:DNA-directed RNA polymerase subunit epsilon [Listeria costaricensis]